MSKAEYWSADPWEWERWPIGKPRARARVTIRNRTVYVEVYNVATGDVLVTDNTGVGAWARMVTEAYEDAFAFSRVLNAGHKLKPWGEVVGASRGEL